MVDAAENRTRADIDYNVVAPYRITDPNENVAEALYDPLGVIMVSTAQGHILGQDGSPILYGSDRLSAYTVQPDTDFASILADPARFLQNTTQFSYYELDTWERFHLPLRSISLVREELVHDGRGGGTPAGRIQTTLSYIDGYGRNLQSKQRVEPGPAIRRDESGAIILDRDGHPEEAQATERWLVSGHTVYNNKQQPVRQYEPFYSAIADFEPDAALQTFGVSTHSYYDPIGRLVRQELPNGTFTRVEITPWEIRNHDLNDTVDESLYKAIRDSLPAENPERQALDKALEHAHTPSIVRMDPLGREIVQIATSGNGTDRLTENHLDSQGNILAITDPRGLAAFTYRRDMLGQVLRQHSIDAGDRWTLADAQGRVIHQWDGRGVHTHYSYDALDRPISVHVDGTLGLNQVVERMVYGAAPAYADAALKNARGRLVEHYDQAGVLSIRQYTPDGKPLRTERRLLENYKSEPDWTTPAAVVLDPSSFITEGIYDALGRITEQRLPDGTTRFISYLQSGGVARVGVTTADGELNNVSILRDSAFNARGQRTRSALGNGVEIAYQYDSETFRMQRLTAESLPRDGTSDARVYQDIEYTYDPVGNISHLVDQAQQPEPAPAHVLQGLRVSSHSDFTYDAFYQLKVATGRVHQALEQHDYRPDLPSPCMKGTRHLTLNNGAAVERYTRTYDYDLSGNIQQIQHRSVTDTARGWTTTMWISTNSNRSLPAEDHNGFPIANPESCFDANGNCSSLSHLRAMDWNYRNNLSRAVIIDRSAEGRPNDAEYYVYGSDGMRVRKVHEALVNGDIEITEKIYFGDCEIKRVRRGGERLLERTTSHITDGVNRIALIHQWTVDTRGAETDDVAQKKIHYQLSNHLGSSSLELDETGNIISYEEYFPFGGTAFIAGDNVREIALKEYRYSGKERDDNTGFYYYGYRYYAPWMGRWLSTDPIGPEDSLNLYQFVSNNPVNLVDPNGLGDEIPPTSRSMRSSTHFLAEEESSRIHREMYEAERLRAQQRQAEERVRSETAEALSSATSTCEQATSGTCSCEITDLYVYHGSSDLPEETVRGTITCTPEGISPPEAPSAPPRSRHEPRRQQRQEPPQQADDPADEPIPEPAAETEAPQEEIIEPPELPSPWSVDDKLKPPGDKYQPTMTMRSPSDSEPKPRVRTGISRDVDWGTVAGEAGITIATGVGVIAVGVAIVAGGVVTVPTMAIVGVGLLVVFGTYSTLERASEAHEAGYTAYESGAGAFIAGFTDFTGLPRLYEGVTGTDIPTGRMLPNQESDRRLGQGVGGVTLLAGSIVVGGVRAPGRGGTYRNLSQRGGSLRRNAPFGWSAQGLEILSSHQLALHQQLSRSSSRGGILLRRGAASLEDIAALTRATGWEHAVVRLRTGERMLIRGNATGIPQARWMDIRTVIFHTHPGEIPYALAPSGLRGDAGYMLRIGQKSSFIMTGGSNVPGRTYLLGYFNVSEGYWQAVNLPVPRFAGSQIDW